MAAPSRAKQVIENADVAAGGPRELQVAESFEDILKTIRKLIMGVDDNHLGMELSLAPNTAGPFAKKVEKAARKAYSASGGDINKAMEVVVKALLPEGIAPSSLEQKQAIAGVQQILASLAGGEGLSGDEIKTLQNEVIALHYGTIPGVNKHVEQIVVNGIKLPDSEGVVTGTKPKTPRTPKPPTGGKVETVVSGRQSPFKNLLKRLRAVAGEEGPLVRADLRNIRRASAGIPLRDIAQLSDESLQPVAEQLVKGPATANSQTLIQRLLGAIGTPSVAAEIPNPTTVRPSLRADAVAKAERKVNLLKEALLGHQTLKSRLESTGMLGQSTTEAITKAIEGQMSRRNLRAAPFPTKARPPRVQQLPRPTSLDRPVFEARGAKLRTLLEKATKELEAAKAIPQPFERVVIPRADVGRDFPLALRPEQYKPVAAAAEGGLEAAALAKPGLLRRLGKWGIGAFGLDMLLNLGLLTKDSIEARGLQQQFDEARANRPSPIAMMQDLIRQRRNQEIAANELRLNPQLAKERELQIEMLKAANRASTASDITF